VSSSVSPIVHPSDEDPVAIDGSEALGGPLGKFARSVGWWLPVRVLIVITAITYALGYLLDYSCRATGWAAPERYEHLCYSDIPPLYSLRGFADGYLPYLQTPPGGQPLEYPVLTGIFMQISAVITNIITNVATSLDTARTFFDVNVLLLFIPLVITVIATSMTVSRRPWDALMVAAAPTMILAATINWDLLPLAFSGVAFVLWSRKHEFSAGLLLGLAIAAKFYPLIFLAGFLLLTIRTGQWKAFGKLLVGSAIAWLVVNVPFIIGNFDGWSYFYTFSKTRGEDFGSPWFAMTQWGIPGIPADSLNNVATGAFVVLAAAVAVLVLTAKRRPRLPQVLFLLIAAFVLTNKVYSPQYVLWLIPLAVLARPKWRDFLIWQVGELIYFGAIWWFLVGYGVEDTKGLTPQLYATAVFIHIAATIYFAIMVIRDIVRPEHDPIRTDGFAEDTDDPAGGVFDKAPDVFVLRSSSSVR
jgi:uncharacterized membrane protein